jgi:hypothetical protein
MAEITDETNIADAFGFIPLMWASGVTIGYATRFFIDLMPDIRPRPIVGGILARPAERWPNTCGKLALFRENPYFLPGLFAAFFSLLCALLTLTFLKEVCSYFLWRGVY